MWIKIKCDFILSMNVSYHDIDVALPMCCLCCGSRMAGLGESSRVADTEAVDKHVVFVEIVDPNAPVWSREFKLEVDGEPS